MYEQIEKLVDFLEAYDGWVNVRRKRGYVKVEAFARLDGKTYAASRSVDPTVMTPEAAAAEIERLRHLVERETAAHLTDVPNLLRRQVD